jgi:hypothetical protein
MHRCLLSSASVEWPTPENVYGRLDGEFKFTMDPCPFGGTEDGLARLFKPWAGHRIFCNPPYGREVIKWLERWKEADLAVYLLAARTDTRWFHSVVLPYASEIRFIKGRLTFGNAKAPAPFPSMVVIFKGEQYVDSYTGRDRITDGIPRGREATLAR